MPRGRRLVLAFALALLVASAPACSLRHHSVATRKGAITVTPASGAPGTSFSLTASGFRPGEAMTFEIELPNKAHFVGPSHTADAQGTVTSTYVPQPGDPPGIYTILGVGNEGTRAQGSLTLTANG
jgi:hypothetical protein